MARIWDHSRKPPSRFAYPITTRLGGRAFNPGHAAAGRKPPTKSWSMTRNSCIAANMASRGWSKSVAAFLGLPGAAPGTAPPTAMSKPRKKPVAVAVPTSTWGEVLDSVAVPGVAEDLRGEAWFDPTLPLPLFADAPVDHRTSFASKRVSMWSLSG